MEKRFIFVLALWLATGGCLQAQSRYHDPEHQFSLTLPAGWSRLGDLPASAVFRMGSSGTELLVYSFPGRSLEEMVNSLESNLKNLGQKTFEKTLTIHEVPCSVWVREQGGEAIVVAAFKSGELGFVLLGTLPRQRSETAVDEVFEVLKSFRVERTEIEVDYF